MSGPDELAGLVGDTWSRVRYVAAERVDLLLRTVCAMRDGSDDPDNRQEAAQAAHKLVGALGTYGFPEGSDTARRAEELLVGQAPPPPAVVDEVVGELMWLRTAIDRGVGER